MCKISFRWLLPSRLQVILRLRVTTFEINSSFATELCTSTLPPNDAAVLCSKGETYIKTHNLLREVPKPSLTSLGQLSRTLLPLPKSHSEIPWQVFRLLFQLQGCSCSRHGISPTLIPIHRDLEHLCCTKLELVELLRKRFPRSRTPLLVRNFPHSVTTTCKFLHQMSTLDCSPRLTTLPSAPLTACQSSVFPRHFNSFFLGDGGLSSLLSLPPLEVSDPAPDN